jgi:uncharacterized protein YhaN
LADPRLTYRQVALQIGKSKSWRDSRWWVQKLVQARTSDRDPNHPFGGEEENEARYARHDKTVLKDPKRRAEAIASLPAEERAEIAKQAMADPETRKQMRSNPDAEKIMQQHRSRVRLIRRRRPAGRARTARRLSGRSQPSTPTRPR